MRIYTKSGDDGSTGLIGGTRVLKDDLIVDSIGTIDELNAAVGLAISMVPASALVGKLVQLQARLFELGAELATPEGTSCPVEPTSQAHVRALEDAIDDMSGELDSLRNFILPGGSLMAAQLHVCRCKCRHAERVIVALSRKCRLSSDVLAYVNRLSDWFFTAARYANHLDGVSDVTWHPAMPNANNE
jgi:cob(I)alamin adenosyltransferase